MVNYHTLSDFRVENKEALDKLFTHLLGLLSAEGLVSLEQVMHDGTKVGAQAGSNSFHREATLEEHLQAARKRVGELGDPQHGEEARERVQRLEMARKELEKVRAAKSGEQKQEARVSLTDPEARVMKQADGGFAPSYNVQVTTGAQEKIILAVGVSQTGSDFVELVPAIGRVEENLGEKPARLVLTCIRTRSMITSWTKQAPLSPRVRVASCSEEDRKTLNAWSGSPTMESRLVDRARRVRGCIDGAPVSQIARHLRVRPNVYQTLRQNR